jgi:hypothetical protein
MENDIDQNAYLSYARRFTPLERVLIERYNEWLPRKIIDCHAHCNLKEHVNYVRKKDYNHMLSTFLSFSLEESHSWNVFFHKNKEIRTLRFPSVVRGVDHKKANLYLLNNSPRKDRIALCK